MSTGTVHEVRVFPLDADPRGEAKAGEVELMYGERPGLRTADVYLIELDADHPDPAGAIELLADSLLTDPVTQRYEIGPGNWDDSRVVEVGRKPGVQDPDARAIQHAAGYLGIKTTAVATATQYRFAEDTSDGLRANTLKILVNPTVDAIHTSSPTTLLVSGEAAPARRLPISELSLAELRDLSKQNSWHMSDADLMTMQHYALRRIERGGQDLTNVEAEFIAARRSDHCAHTTFGAEVLDAANRHARKKPLFSRIKETAKKLIGATSNVLSAFDDNAGVFRFYEGYAIAIKKETHNSPSAVEPYGGAGTGTGGVIRDILGAGRAFKTILLDAMFAHARPDYPEADLPPGVKPPAYLRAGVIAGSADYGNQMGIPTAEVDIVTDNSFVAKPTVMVGAIGIAPEEYAYKGEPRVGDLVITIGGATGRDGLHGATFSSGSMTAETSTKNASSVQIGDPIMEKMVADALLELRDAGLIRAVTDCGAAGYGSAVGEMGAKTGVTINLDQIPTKYPGLEPWELLLSESQERMVLAVEPNQKTLDQLAAILAKHGVDWKQIGKFDGSMHFTALYKGEPVAHLPYTFLENDFKISAREANWQPPARTERHPHITDMASTIEQVLAHPNVRYTGDVIAQFDTTVQGNTVLPLFGGVHHDMPNDAVVITPLADTHPEAHFGLIRSHTAHPAIMQIDPYQGAINTYFEALSKFVAVGGSPVNEDIQGDQGDAVVAMNNYSWPTPDTPHKFGALDRAVDGVNLAQEKSGVPVISGKDSVSSTFVGPKGQVLDINPVLDITIVGAIPDARWTVTADLKRPGSTLVLVGTPDYEGMAGSILHDVANGESARLPQPDLDRVPRTLLGMHNAITTGHVLSAKAIGRGGLMATVAQMSFGGQMGVTLDSAGDAPDLSRWLFNETPGCFVVEVDSPERAARLFGRHPHVVIGRTNADDTITITHADETVVQTSVDRLRAAWKAQP